MILLLMQSPRAAQCKDELELRLQQPVTLCPSLSDTSDAVRIARYDALVLDQDLLDQNPSQADVLSRYAGTAVTVLINPGIWGVDRVCKEIEFALKRACREKKIAEESARNELKEQLCGAVTGILLSSELALNSDSLPPLVEEKLRSVRDMALHMSSCLR